MLPRLLLALLAWGASAPFPASAQIVNNWGIGSVRSGVTTGTSITTSREQSSTTTQSYGGSSYSATGENIEASGPLGLGTNYTIARPGEPFQFSETQRDGGLVQMSVTGRSVDSTTTTNSLSVFAESN